MIKEYLELKTKKQRCEFLKNHTHDEKYLKLLNYDKISASSVDIIYKVLSNQKIEYKQNYWTNKKK